MTTSPHLVDTAPLASTPHGGRDPAPDSGETVDERRPLVDLFRDLRTSGAGLSVREAGRRQLVYGPNTLTRRAGRRWPGELLGQFTQPLAILLALAAVLAWVGGTPALAVAVVAVILLNAGSRSSRKCRPNGPSKPSPRSCPRPPASYATASDRRSPPATPSPATY